MATLPDHFFKYAITIGVALIGLQVVDNIDRRLGSLYVAVVLLGVVLSQREAVLKFTSFLQAQGLQSGGSA